MPRSGPRLRRGCGWAWCVVATNDHAGRLHLRRHAARSTSRHTFGKYPSPRRCEPSATIGEPLDDQPSAMESGAGITVGHENLRTGDGPSTSHTPPGGSPHIKPTRPLPTSCPGTPRRLPTNRGLGPGQWHDHDGAPTPPPYRCGPHRRVPCVRYLVACRMRRPINDARADSRGRARIPIVRGSERRIGGATNPRTAATRVGVYDCRAGRLDVQ